MMPYFKKICFFSLLLCFSFADSMVDQVLKKIAITEGYGYKKANLDLLVGICKEIKNKNYGYAVPEFFGFNSAFMQAFIKTVLKKDIVEEWKLLIKNSGLSDITVLKTALKDKRFPDGFLDGLRDIESGIRKSFNDFVKTNTKDPVLLFGEVKNSTIDLSSFTQLMQSIKKNNEKLMVRSTGKEDTDELANAGGNESVANVGPDAAELLSAIGIVIASYFSEKSLTQRLGAGDISIPEDPLTPIIIQRMITGEKSRCGVMFTEEPEGALSKGLQKKTNGNPETSGLTIVQAAYGHNEGVVNGIVPVDTYLINREQEQYAVIRPKLFSVVPTKALKLGRKNNKGLAIVQPVLEPKAVEALKQLADRLEDYYKKPMDVEFVISNKLGKQTIYIVQARPIVHNKNQPMPSYLNFGDKTVAKMASMRGSVICSGGGELKFITNNRQIIVKKTLKVALDEYLGRSDKNDIRAILIEENAPATSHEATAFRSELKPVICMASNFPLVEQWTKKQNLKLVIDTQQQRVVEWQGDENLDINTFIEDAFAVYGWISYPLAQQLSVYSMIPAKQLDQLKTDLKEVLVSEKDPEFEAQLKIYAANPLHFLQKKFSILKDGSPDEAKKALKYLIVPVSRMYAIALKQSPVYRRRTERLYAHILQVSDRVLANLSVAPDNKYYLSKRLFPIHILETLFFQHHSDYEGLYGESVIKIWTQMHDEMRGVVGLADEGEIGKLLGVMGNYALTGELRENWKKFIVDLGAKGLSWDVLTAKIARLKKLTVLLQVAKEGGADAQKGFEKLTQERKSLELELGQEANRDKADFLLMIRLLGKLDMIPLWLHASFAKYHTIGEIGKLTKEVSDAKVFLENLTMYKERINALAVEGFSDPKKFIALWNDFETNIFSPLISDSFIKEVDSTNRLGKLAVTKVMELFVRKVDAMIKAVTGSSLFVVTSLPEDKTFVDIKADKTLLKQQINDKKNKIFTFHLMLQNYLLLLKKWLPFASFGNFTSVVLDVTQRFENLASKIGDHEQLEAKNFNVATVIIGGSAAWERQRIILNTHEKIFMWVHQDLEAIIANMVKRYGISEKEYPENFEEINKKFYEKEFTVRDEHETPTRINMSLIGTSLDANQLVLTYNLPQRNHSASVRLTYNMHSGTTTVFFNLFGYDTEGRWELSADFVEIKSTELAVAHTVSGTNEGLEVTWIIPKNATIKTVEDILHLMDILCVAADYSRAPATILVDEFGLTAESIKSFVALDRLYFGIRLAIDKALDDPNPATINAIFIILEKVLDPGSDYARNSEEAFVLTTMTTEDLHSFVNDLVADILEKSELLTKEHINYLCALLMKNQEYLLDTIGQFLSEMPCLKESDKRAIYTHAFYRAKKKPDWWSEELMEDQIFKNDELAQFIIDRGIAIFRITHDDGLFVDALAAMNKNQRVIFFDTLATALDHRDVSISKNAYLLFRDMLKNTQKYGTSTSIELKKSIGVFEKALKDQGKDAKTEALALLEAILHYPKTYNAPIVQEILVANADRVMTIFIDKIKKARNLEVLEDERERALGLFSKFSYAMPKKDITKKTVMHEYITKSAQLAIGTIDSGDEITSLVLTSLEMLYKTLETKDPTIKKINKLLIDNYLKGDIRQDLEKLFRRVKELSYDDTQRFITLLVNAIKQENRTAEINTMFKQYFKGLKSVREAGWILGYIIWLHLGTYQDIVPVVIDAPLSESDSNYWIAAEYIRLLKTFIDTHDLTKLSLVTFGKDPFEIYRKKMFDTEVLNHIADEKDFAELSDFVAHGAEVVLLTDSFEKLKKMLPDTVLSEPADILRYTILLNTEQFDKVPQAVIAKSTEQNKECISILKDFIKSNKTKKMPSITFS